MNIASAVLTIDVPGFIVLSAPGALPPIGLDLRCRLKLCLKRFQDVHLSKNI
jgi:hypothetical protein